MRELSTAKTRKISRELNGNFSENRMPFMETNGAWFLLFERITILWLWYA